MSVKRYEWVACDEHSCHCDVVESAEGDMVDYEDYAALEARCAALAAESEERRQFILNGVEFGFIRLPDEDTRDAAKATYERCLIGIKSSPCQKCNDTGMTDSGGTQPWGEPIEIECDCGAAQLRKGVQS
ncbi:hypothetical protein [Enterobacter hormaechei]|uniref:hypothetical protein n=1 Tax=Enterobacter hormaechei TaxID=158836 RepID=UPI001980D9E0|nr:hypothetical protein [Enterobacter hormaechei]MBN4832255.1 hypothetical protein [Enterobacter hormaechei]